MSEPGFVRRLNNLKKKLSVHNGGVAVVEKNGDVYKYLGEVYTENELNTTLERKGITLILIDDFDMED